MNFAYKGPHSQSYGFSSSHVQMWELDHKEGRVPKNWCFWTVVLEKILRVPWTARRSNQSILKEIIHEYSLEELMLKWKLNHFGEKSLIIGNDPASGKDWSQEEKGATEDEMVGWHDWVNAHGFQQILGNSCPSWGCKETWLREWTTTKPQDI